mgnify:FL=1
MTLNSPIAYYTTSGSVRGSCGHHHRTEAAAQACVERDQAGIRRAYPSTFPTRSYSDRVVVAVHRDGGETRPIEEREDAEQDAAYAAHEARLRYEREQR